MADTKTDKKKEQKQKRPSALKRNLQSEKKRLANRSFRSSVHTAIRSLETALAKPAETTQITEQLKKIYSIVDKGVKRGILKPRKAARTKSRLTVRCIKH
ncbi:MAG TPA: 30S ribosomal protein S20 [Chlamydiales bacterium]|nr:30S ribosomal protein S20 [Chlamydiales bacterium]